MLLSTSLATSLTRSNASLIKWCLRAPVPRTRLRIRMGHIIIWSPTDKTTLAGRLIHHRSCPPLYHFFLPMDGGTSHPYKALFRRPPVFKFNERWTCSSLSDLPSRAYYPQVNVEACFMTCCAAVSTNKDILACPAILYLISQSRTCAYGIGELGEQPGILRAEFAAENLIPPV